MALAISAQKRRIMKRNVLIIEGDFYLAEAYLHLVQSRTTHNVHMIQDEQQAISYLEDQTPDVLVIDMDLPKQSSFKILNMLKASNRLKDIVVIALCTDPVLCKQLKSHVSYAMQKPIPQTTLISILQDIQ